MAASEVNDDCGMCNKVVNEKDEALFCEDNCYRWRHRACINMTKRTYNALKVSKAIYRCDSCRVEMGGNATNKTLETLTEMVSNLSECVNKLQKQMEESIIPTQNKIDDLLEENKRLKESNISLEERASKLYGEVNYLLEVTNDLEQYSKNYDLEIAGVPTYPSEDCPKICKSLCQVVGYNLEDADIDACHRLRKSKYATGPPNIILRLTRKNTKQIILKLRKEKGSLHLQDLNIAELKQEGRNQLYINEHLTGYNKKILARARTLKREGKLASVWSTWGKIFVQKTVGGESRNIKDLYSLQNYCEQATHK